MPSERVADYLAHILQEIRFAEEFVGKLSQDELAADPLRLRAVVRCLEIISEASRRLPSELKAGHPHIPWQDIAGAGNIYRHDYNQVLTSRIWETATSLSDLRRVVEQELAR
jgi:uncharacterized protein with HEPN domain